MASYTIRNATGDNLGLGPVNLAAGEQKVVAYITSEMATAAQQGRITITPDGAGADVSTITDNSTGTVATPFTIAAVTDAATAANAIAVLAAALNTAIGQINSLQGQVNALSNPNDQ